MYSIKNIRIISSTIILFLLFILSGCNSSKYWSNRKNDALDIVSFTYVSNLGARGRCGPINAGLYLRSTE